MANIISLSELQEYKALAERHANNVSAKIILHLLGVVQELREEVIQLRLKTADKHGEYNDLTPCPFGRHKGEQLGHVPSDWLEWWFSKNSDRSMIIFDMDYGAWPKRGTAVKALRLHDYIKQKQQRNGDPIQDSWEKRISEA